MGIRTVLRRNGDFVVEQASPGKGGTLAIKSKVTARKPENRVSNFVVPNNDNMLYTMSGSSDSITGITASLSSPVDNAGQSFLFRTVSNHQHHVTSSMTNGFVFNGMSSDYVKFGGFVGENQFIMLVSTGNNYIVSAYTGSVVINV
jgi:hypothetical protein